jgi:uncharacterized protein YfaS (alpha-2-macroglobulin family)
MPIFSLLVVIFLVLAALGGELPTDEKGLIDYAQARMNRRQWRDADRALTKCIENYPKGEHVARAHIMLGRLHIYQSRRRSTGRDWLNRYLEKWPEGAQAWRARFLIADSYARDKDKTRAIDAFKHILKNAPTQSLRQSAAQRVLSLKGKYFQIHVNQTFTEGEKARVQVGLRGVSDVRFRMFRLPYEELVERLDTKEPSLPAAAKAVPRDKWEKVEEWTERFDVAWNRYTNKKIDVPARRRGFYIVEGEHDEVVMRVGFPVNRHGVIVKSAAGRTVVFGQDRVDGTPIPGMRVRVLQHDKDPREAVTGDDGLCVLTGTGSDAFLVASKGDDFAFANVQTYGWDGPASRYYVVSDRPIYRPNQRVQFKIVHRTQEGANLTIAKDLRVRVRVLDPKGNEVHVVEKKVSDFGSLDGSFQLGDEPPLGTYRIQIDPIAGNVPAVRDWRAGRGQFRVDEYRKPEYKVGVSFDKGHYVQGGLLKATIQADYYFGSPVPNATVKWNIRRSRHWGGGVKHRHAWYRWYVDDYRMGPRHHGDNVASGTGKLDENGRLVLDVGLKDWDWDATYSVQASVTDLSRRTVEGFGGVRVNRAEFSLGVSLDRYVYKPGDTVKVTVKAERPDGTPVKERAVEVLLNRRRWNKKEYEETEVAKVGGITNAEGVAEIDVPVKQAGSFVIVARSNDKQGNKTWTKRWVWIADRQWSGGYVKWDGVDVVPDKASYEPGETATFLVSSQYKDLHVLVTLESSRIHYEKVVKLNGHTATVSVKLDDKTMVPNVWATVTTLHKGSVQRRSRSVMIDPSDRFLSVEIKPSRNKYRPRDPAAVEIVTRDKDGKPVEAEVFLSVVDEAIYALQSEYAQDIRQFFVPKRWNRVPTRTSLDYWQWGEAGLDEEVVDEGGGPAAPASEARGLGAARGRGGGKAGKKMKSDYAATEVRSKFADTMYWASSVKTDVHGRATVRIDQVADNLTTWRVTARAASKAGLVGQGHRTFIVRKDVIVRLHAPRFYTQGDKATVSAVVHNYLDNPKQVKVEIEADGLDLHGPASQVVEIGAQAEQRFDWPVRVRAPGKAVIAVKALTDEESDAMRRTVPLLPHGSLQWTSSTHLVKGALDTSVALPKDAIPGASELTVVVSPTHAATVLDALDYLADYPYGCVEQTMSRFLPSTITAQVLRKLNLSRPELEKELPDMISAGLQRLYNFQHGDGGWGWWKNDQSNPFTTAYVVYGLAQAQQADVKVENRVLVRGVRALTAMLEKADDDEQRVYILFALSAAGSKVPGVRNALADNLKDLSAVHKALLALVLSRDGEKKEAQRVLASLAAEAQGSGGLTYFQGPKHYRWTGHNVETTAWALKAFMAIDPENEIVPRIVSWLAMERSGNRWVSTRQTATVVFAVADYIARTGDLDPDLTLTLKVNGEELYTRRVTKENWRDFKGVTKLGGKLLRTGDNRIEVVAQGRGTPVCSVYLKHFRKADEFTPSAGGLRVNRTYHRVMTSGGKKVAEALEDGATVRSGDEIKVTIKVNADREYRYLMLEDPLPAGFEPVRPHQGRGRWGWWYSHKEFRDEKVAVAITYLPQGERKITYTMRAETPGSFRVLPTLVWNMYRLGEGANSAGASFTVVDN